MFGHLRPVSARIRRGALDVRVVDFTAIAVCEGLMNVI